MSKPVYFNENDLIRRGDVIAAFENLKCIAAGKECSADDLKCQFTGTILTVPPASENAAVPTNFVLNHGTVLQKMELAEKILELNKKIARIDDSIQHIDNSEKKAICSMMITCDVVMPFADIDAEDAKTMLRNYRINLRMKLDALWDKFATINPWQLKEDKQ